MSIGSISSTNALNQQNLAQILLDEQNKAAADAQTAKEDDNFSSSTSSVAK